jgi:hypothetical protein
MPAGNDRRWQRALAINNPVHKSNYCSNWLAASCTISLVEMFALFLPVPKINQRQEDIA